MIPVTRTSLPPLDEYAEQLKRIWETGWLTNHGELTQRLERDLAAYLQVPNVRLLSNGSIAINIALRVLGVKGDVVTTPFTFSATTNALVWEGLRPVFADVDPETFNIDPEDVERKITDKTTAILAVHVYGNPCDTDALQRIADRHGLRVIYDAAHAFGVHHQGKSVLTAGDASTLSFHATKVWHTIEGGAIVARDPDVQEKVALLRNNGIRNEFDVMLPGTNAKLNEFQAAMGLAGLPGLDERIARRLALYDRYVKALEGADVQLQRLVATKYNAAYMPVVFRTHELREAAHDALVAAGVKPRRYFYPLTTEFHYFPAGTTQQAKVPVAASLSPRVLCLPMFPGLGSEDVDRIVNVVRRVSG